MKIYKQTGDPDQKVHRATSELIGGKDICKVITNVNGLREITNNSASRNTLKSNLTHDSCFLYSLMIGTQFLGKQTFCSGLKVTFIWDATQENLSLWFLTRSNTNCAVWPQKMARGFNYFRWDCAAFYVAKTKLLRSWSAPLFSHMQKSGFLMTQLISDRTRQNDSNNVSNKVLLLIIIGLAFHTVWSEY